MQLESIWNTVEKATSRYCLETSLLLKWVEEGVIRSEQHDTRSMLVNVEDVERKLRHAKNRSQSYRDCD